MVTVIQERDQQNPWAAIAEKGITNAVKGYTERSDEMALKRSLESLGDDADPRDVMKAIIGTNTYSKEAKDTALKNYIGAENFALAQKKAANEEKRLEAQFKKQQDDAVKRDEDRKVANELKQAQVEETKRHNIAQEENAKTKNDLIANKPEPQTYLDKLKTRAYFEEENQLDKDLPLLLDAKKNLEEVERLSNEMGWLGAMKKYTSEDGKTLEALAFTSLQPIVKLFNPSGTLAVKKLEMMTDMYLVKPTDSPMTRQGKIIALKTLNNQAIERLQDRKKFLQKWNNNPPRAEEDKFNQESELMLDAMLDVGFAGKAFVNQEGLPTGEKYKGRTMTNKDGTKIYYDGTQWIQK